MAKIRILIVDDHDIVRIGLRAILDEVEQFDVVGEAATGEDALQLVESLLPHVVLMDMLLPTISGATATRVIGERWPRVRVVALSGADVSRHVLPAIQAGALGYVSKSSTQEELVQSIRWVHAGRASMPVELTQELVGHVRRHPTAPAETLSRREIEILLELARGLTNREIADRFGIAEATVRTHVSNILGKISASNRVEATLYALSQGLTTIEECLQDGPTLS